VSQYIQRHGKRQISYVDQEMRCEPLKVNDNISENALAVHTGILHDWYFYESHARTRGVWRSRYKSWETINNGDPLILMPFEGVDFELMTQFLEKKTTYSIIDIRKLFGQDIGNTFKQLLSKTKANLNPLSLPPDRDAGMICSEYVASCCPQICEFYSLKPHEITPVLIQNWMHLQKNDKYWFSKTNPHRSFANEYIILDEEPFEVIK